MSQFGWQVVCEKQLAIVGPAHIKVRRMGKTNRYKINYFLQNTKRPIRLVLPTRKIIMLYRPISDGLLLKAGNQPPEQSPLLPHSIGHEHRAFDVLNVGKL